LHPTTPRAVNPDAKQVLTSGQVATVIVPPEKRSDILAIDGHHKAEICAKIWGPVNEHMA
jgi:hypothetical protein